MYSVPFDCNLFSNWWNVKLYSRRREADKETFSDMDGSDKVKGDNAWHTKYIGSGLSVNGAMGRTGQSNLEIRVEIEARHELFNSQLVAYFQPVFFFFYPLYVLFLLFVSNYSSGVPVN